MGTARRPKDVIDGDYPTTSFEEPFAERFIGHTVADVERELIIGTLNHVQGNRTRASVVLGISVRCLRDKIQNYRAQGVSVPEPKLSACSQLKK
jgi:DNA-binding NtrC family response regulator